MYILSSTTQSAEGTQTNILFFLLFHFIYFNKSFSGDYQKYKEGKLIEDD